MAISFIGATSGSGAGTGVSLPGSYADGDIVIAFSYNRSSTTIPGAPTGGTYTFVLNNASGFTNRAVLYYRVISGDTTFPGFASNSTHYALAIYRGQNKGDPIGGSSSTTNNTATISYADFTEEKTNSTSWIIACGAHRNDTAGTIVLDGDWSERTFFNTEGATPAGKIGIGDKQDITSWGGDTVATGGSANGHSSITIELKAEQTIVGDPGSFTITGTNATLTKGGSSGFTLAADAGSVAITGTDASLEFGREVAADAGSFAITGTDANLEYGREVAADAGSLAITGTDAGLSATRKVTADAGSVAITGTDAGLEFGRTLSADAGSFTITGTDAGLEFGREVAADAGSVAITGTDANLEYGRLVAANAGSVAITGTDATLIYGTVGSFTLAAEAGSVAITGTTASLEAGFEVAADAGSVVITGTDAGFAAARLLSADTGSVTVTGIDATLTYGEVDPVLTADAGSVVITGAGVTLTYSGATPTRVRDGDGAGGERSYRRRRKTGYRVYKWQIDSPDDLPDVAGEIAAEVDSVPAAKAAEFIETNADILSLLGVQPDVVVAAIEAAPPSMMDGVASVEMERIRVAIEEFLDEEAAIEMLLIA